MQALLDNGANPTLTNRFGENVLHIASRKGKVKVVTLILDTAGKNNMVMTLVKQTDNVGNTPLVRILSLSLSLSLSLVIICLDVFGSIDRGQRVQYVGLDTCTYESCLHTHAYISATYKFMHP
jgi:ankyrin repeat protein